MVQFLEFEKPIADLDKKIRELKELSGSPKGVNLGKEVAQLETRLDKLLKDTYSRLTPWQKTQVARHPERPHFRDYAEALFEDFTPLAGDRAFGEDKAVLGGLARFRGEAVMVMGHEKGFDTETRIRHNFGMAKPEGYRKAIRMMELASRFGLPIITLVDTSGAYPGVDAEERGQAEAIARSTEACLNAGVPVISVIVGEGGSGGAVALAAGNKILMLQHAVYSVISPEGCASILWRTPSKAEEAANALKITAQDLHRLGVIDAIVPEPVGGAHRDWVKTMLNLGDAIGKALKEFSKSGMTPEEIRKARREKFLAMGRAGLM